MTRVDINIEEFKQLYIEGVSHRDLAKKYNCGTTKIQNLRKELGLPVRIIKRKTQVYVPKHVDEKRFRKMYESGYSYQGIGEEIGIATVHTVAKYVRVFGLPERDRTLARIDKDKFTKMYHDGCSLRSLCREFRMTQNTLYRIIKALDLPDRTGKPKQEVAHKPIDTEFKESDDNFDNSDGNNFDNNDEKINLDDGIIKPNHNKSFFSVPTLRELKKRKEASDMVQAEIAYKNRGMYNGRN